MKKNTWLCVGSLPCTVRPSPAGAGSSGSSALRARFAIGVASTRAGLIALLAGTAEPRLQGVPRRRPPRTGAPTSSRTLGLVLLADPDEVLEHRHAGLRVLHLGVEGHAEERPRLVPHDLDGAVLGRRQHLEVLGQPRDLVVVRGPDDGRGRDALQDVAGVGDGHLDLAELGALAGRGLAAEVARHELVAGADAEDEDVEAVEVVAAGAQGPFEADAGRASRKQKAVKLRALQLLDG